jgi:hypothetical protein
MYTHLMKGWEDLPDASKRALGFDPTVGTESEEAGFNHFAKVFMDYAGQSFQWALAARRRRLGIEGELPAINTGEFESGE